MAKAKKKAAAKGGKKEAQTWPYYDLGGVALSVSPHPEAPDSYALFVVVGDTGYAVAGYADADDAREAAAVLDEAMSEAQKGHTHGEDCDHNHEELEISLDDLDDEPKKGKGKAKKAAKPAKKPAAKAKKPAAKAKKKK